jgi:DNA-binding NtrC family response regulator
MAHLPDTLDTLIGAGRFDDALSLLGAARPARIEDPCLFDAYEAELLYETGRETKAAQLAEDSLARRLDPSTATRLNRVLALCAFDMGDVPAANSYLAIAQRHCGPRDKQTAILDLTRLSFQIQLEPLTAVMARLPHVRRSAAASGDPHILALLRIYVARCEARANGLSEVRRHHNLVSGLLERYPNRWLEGLLEIDRSVVDVLTGDTERALHAAQRALEYSKESGHFHTRIAAHINLSHIQERRGCFESAKSHIDAVLSSVDQNCHLRRAVLDSWANLLITARDYERCRIALKEAAERATKEKGARPHWDAITEAYSRARLAQAEGRWAEAADELSGALETANAFNDTVWRRRVLVTKAKCLAMCGKQADALAALIMNSNDGAHDPQEVAEFQSALAALHKDDPLGPTHIQRAARVAIGAGNLGLSQDVTRGFQQPLDDAIGKTEAASPSLDAAVALLELSGHPHILGPETVALIKGAGCATAMALVVKSPAGVRIVEAVDWTPAEASAAAAVATDAIEHLALGTRGDEVWFLAIQPRRDLEGYCTFATIRKLLALALSLETYRRDEKQRAALWPADALDSDPECIWASEQMLEVLNTARRIAANPISVLITGETGTGKEMVARAIHRASNRSDRPFLPFNCAAVPRDLLESQLFGHRKGAFTGADAGFPGVIRSAAGGTLFLDEIGEIGPEMQPKLLRFLETHEIHPLGEPHPVKVDVRVIAATNASVEQLMADGRFRGDLFYRLNVMRLSLPPLRERREEIPPLVQHYVRKYADEQRKGQLTLPDDTLEYLLLFSWPGNVRQLANEVQRMVALAEPDGTLTPALLSPEIQASRRTIAATPAAEIEVRVALDQPLPVAVDMLEQVMVRRALDRTHGRVEEASRLLGISRKGLFLKRRRWGLAVSES